MGNGLNSSPAAEKAGLLPRRDGQRWGLEREPLNFTSLIGQIENCVPPLNVASGFCGTVVASPDSTLLSLAVKLRTESVHMLLLAVPSPIQSQEVVPVRVKLLPA